MRAASLPLGELLACCCLLGAVACSPFSSSDTPAAEDGGSGNNGGTADSGDPDAGLESDATAPAPAFLSVFVSSKTHIGQFPPSAGGSALTGFSGADAFCKDSADASAVSRLHGLTWVAWLSASLGAKGDVRDRLPRAAAGEFLHQYRLTDGVTVVFPKGFNLDATDALPQNPIGLDENGKVLSDALVWTGTLPNGKTRASTDCGGWNAPAPSAVTGVLGHSGVLATWSADGNLGADPCSTLHNVYCFQVP